VASRSGRHQPRPRGQLFSRTDVHARDLRTVGRRAAALGHRELRVDLVEVLADHVVDADALGIGLFTRLREKNDVSIQLQPRPFQQQHGHEIRRQHRLVVLGAAAPDVAVLDHRAKRIDRPLLALHADHVGVSQDQQRPLRPVSLEPRDQVGAIGVHREGLRRDAFGFKHLLQVVDRQRFVARRGVEHHEGAVSLENLDLQLVPVERPHRRGRLRTHRAERCHGEPENQETVHANAPIGWDGDVEPSQDFLFAGLGDQDESRRAKPLALPNATMGLSANLRT
jgi:hypothetical protein